MPPRMTKRKLTARGAKYRVCVKCDNVFWSEGPGNRRCNKCSPDQVKARAFSLVVRKEHLHLVDSKMHEIADAVDGLPVDHDGESYRFGIGSMRKTASERIAKMLNKKLKL